MRKVLTKISSMQCLHKGKVAPTNTQSVLKINGDDVLVGSLKGSISACIQVSPPSSNKPCLEIDTQKSGGVSSVLKVNGNAVLLDTATGTTTQGTPTNTWSVINAEQQVLQAD